MLGPAESLRSTRRQRSHAVAPPPFGLAVLRVLVGSFLSSNLAIVDKTKTRKPKVRVESKPFVAMRGQVRAWQGAIKNRRVVEMPASCRRDFQYRMKRIDRHGPSERRSKIATDVCITCTYTAATNSEYTHFFISTSLGPMQIKIKIQSAKVEEKYQVKQLYSLL